VDAREERYDCAEAAIIGASWLAFCMRP
jgi:hypothetical protein